MANEIINLDKLTEYRRYEKAYTDSGDTANRQLINSVSAATASINTRLSSQMAEVSAATASTNTKLENLSANTASMDVEINTKVVGNTEAIRTLQATATTISTHVTALETDVDTLSSYTHNMDVRLTNDDLAQKGDITNLGTSARTTNTRVNTLSDMTDDLSANSITMATSIGVNRDNISQLSAITKNVSDAYANLKAAVDSGLTTNTYPVDSTPTQGNTNHLVSSAGVYNAIHDLDIAYLDNSATTVDIPDFDAYSDSVWNKPQYMTTAKKKQARVNLGFGDGDIDTDPVVASPNVVTSDGVARGLQGVRNELEVYNVSAHNNGQSFTLSGAIAKVPKEFQRAGIKLTFKSGDSSNYVEWFCTASAWTTNTYYWVQYGQPTDEQTEAAVKGWLDEHPEATTTVEDGSITARKLNQYLFNTEDIQISGDTVGFANRGSSDGMGYVILRKGKTFSEQVTTTNTIYEVRYDFDLSGATVTIPSGCVLKFEGGSVSNGAVVGKDVFVEGPFNVSDFAGTFYDVSGELLEAKVEQNKFIIIHTQKEFEDAITNQTRNLMLDSKTFYINSIWNLPENAILYGINGASITRVKDTYKMTEFSTSNSLGYTVSIKNDIGYAPIFINEENDDFVNISEREWQYSDASDLSYDGQVLKLKIKSNLEYTDRSFGFLSCAWKKILFSIDSHDSEWLYCTPLDTIPTRGTPSAPDPAYDINARGVIQYCNIYNFVNADSVYYSSSSIFIPNRYKEISVISVLQNIHAIRCNGDTVIKNITFKNLGRGIYNSVNNQFNMVNCIFEKCTAPLFLACGDSNQISWNIDKCSFINCGNTIIFENNQVNRDVDVLKFYAVTTSSQKHFAFTNNKIVNDGKLYYPSDRFVMSVELSGNITGNIFVNPLYTAARLNKGRQYFGNNNISYTQDFFLHKIQIPYDNGLIYLGNFLGYDDTTVQNYDGIVQIFYNTFNGWYDSEVRNTANIYIDDGRGDIEIIGNKLLASCGWSINARDVNNVRPTYTKSSIRVRTVGNICLSPIKLIHGSGVTGSDIPTCYGNLILSSKICNLSQDVPTVGLLYTNVYRIDGDSVYLDKDFRDSLTTDVQANVVKNTLQIQGLSNVITSVDDRPPLAKVKDGFSFYDTTVRGYLTAVGGYYRTYDGISVHIPRIGTWDEKPSGAYIFRGFRYYCINKIGPESSTGGLTIIYKGKDANNQDIWVDSLGRHLPYGSDYYAAGWDNRPTDTDNDNLYIGRSFYCGNARSPESKDYGVVLTYKGNDTWVDSIGRKFPYEYKYSGTKAERPTGSQIKVGFMYMQVDSTNGTYPIWASAVNGDTVTWVKADGTSAT